MNMHERPDFADLPIGFGMALAKNLFAMRHFTSLPDQERHAIVERARHIGSQTEMENFVNGMIRH